MKTDRLYRSMLTLFGFVLTCTLVSAVRPFVIHLAPWLAICCQTMKMSMGEDQASWLTLVTQAALGVLLIFGFSVLVTRTWKTYRFVSGLRSASMAEPPARLAQLAAELELSPDVLVLATDVPLAFCFGLLRPHICISTGLAKALTDQELKAVLLHEDHHRRHFDPLRGLLAETLAATFFFLPIASELRDWFLVTTELRADRHAGRVAGRPSLAGALHKILTHPRAMHLSVPGIAGLNATEARIAELLGDRPATIRLSAHRLLTSSTIILLGCMLAL